MSSSDVLPPDVLSTSVSLDTAKDTWTLYIDYSVCIGCESCEAVCKFLYNKPRIVMMRTSEGEVVPLYCRHCRSPLCVKACPQNALTIDEQGGIMLDPMQCRGCQSKACLSACPFGGMLVTDEGVGVGKCDLCAGRRKQGMQPACMEMCPCGAIHFVERNKIRELESPESKDAQKRVLSQLKPKKNKTSR